MSAAVQLDPATIDALAERIVEKQAVLQRPELTLEEAIKYTAHNSRAGFYDWCRRKKVMAIDRGRYRRAALDRAMGGGR